MKIFHVLPKKYPLKTEIASKTLKKKALNKNNDLFSVFLEKKNEVNYNHNYCSKYGKDIHM